MKYKPREAAFDILRRIESNKSFADILINKALSSGNLEGSSGFLTELVYGILSRQKNLDYVIDQFIQGSKKIKSDLRILLRIGAYQILFLNNIPDFAIVSETVELSKQTAPFASGFVNGVLRNILRNKQNIKYPDKKTDKIEFLSTFYSHPEWIIKKWVEQLGLKEAEELANIMGQPAPLTLRVNSLKISRNELKNRLDNENIKTKNTAYSPDGLIVTSPINIASSESFKEGLFTVQDESSQLAVLLLSPKVNESILDLCAAPGGKATYLAQLMKNTGVILATDISQNKLSLVDEHCKRMGISNVKTEVLDATKLSEKPTKILFDKILIDAPCMGLGVIRRNPETKWWLKESDIKEIVKKQQLILENAAKLLVPGGIIIYATCSTTTNENEQVIKDFLTKNNSFAKEDLSELFPQFKDLITKEGYFRSWPHKNGMDGFFVAGLKRVV